MAVAVAVILIVIVPMIVAALVNGNDIVVVIDAVDDQARRSISSVNIATLRSSNARNSIERGYTSSFWK